jgi:hypothetical protein
MNTDFDNPVTTFEGQNLMQHFEEAYKALTQNVERSQACSNLGSANCISTECVSCSDYSKSNELNKFNFAMQQDSIGILSTVNDINVILSEYLPSNTIVVSKDIFEQIRKSTL